MTTRTFLTVHGVIYTVFAFALFFVPTMMWPMYGVQINDQYALFLSQHTSIFLGGIAAVSLMLRDVESGNTAKQLFKALLTTNLLGVVITTYAAITGVFVGFGWSDPAFFLLLSVLTFIQWKKQS
ncbi:Putative membrane protein [Vibrio jasicida]|uniref:Membrane protein n=1 Tax=Vibrio jasicida TaxID=766224 RepID=A0AAU9QKJ8_9VIBR|nr:Putative membrane protein [Vibrio jasicida]CAH1585963.1 Putative membrane protein [Vibrio jasicida]